MRRYKTKRTKEILELKLAEKGIYPEDVLYICDISLTAAKARVMGKVDFKGQEIKKLKEYYAMTDKEAWDLFIEQN